MSVLDWFSQCSHQNDQWRFPVSIVSFSTLYSFLQLQSLSSKLYRDWFHLEKYLGFALCSLELLQSSIYVWLLSASTIHVQTRLLFIYINNLKWPWPFLVGLLACGPPSISSVHLASSSVIPERSVHKSRADNVVRMWMQLRRLCVSCQWVLQRGA